MTVILIAWLAMTPLTVVFLFWRGYRLGRFAKVQKPRPRPYVVFTREPGRGNA